MFCFNTKIYISFLKHLIVPSYEHQKMLTKITNIKTIVDVGANVGQFSLLLFNKFPTAKFFLFEPLKKEYLILRKIFKRNNNFIIKNLALGKKREFIKVNILKRRDSSSILHPTKNNKDIFNDNYITGNSIVKISRLKDCINKINKPSLLKIDVQGYELEVLKGTNLNQFSYIYLEGSDIQLYKKQATIKDIETFLSSKFVKINEFNIQYNNINQKIYSDILYKKILND
jgi:FkbM family methyltransferase